MIQWIKRIIGIITEIIKVENEIKTLSKQFNVKCYKVYISIKQIDLLRACFYLGIYNESDLKERIK